MALQGKNVELTYSALNMPIAREYERRYAESGVNLQEFFDDSLPNLRHHEVKQWGDALAAERAKGD
jgi:hypothetical protein